MSRRISPSTLDALVRLREASGLLHRIGIRRDSDKAQLLEQIREAAEPAAVFDVLPYTISSDGELAQKAAEVVGHLLEHVSVSELNWLDEIARGGWSYSLSRREEWHSLRPSDVRRLQRHSDRAVLLVGLASFHGSGFVREAAVEHLARVSTGKELPFLLLRVADWVAEVRQAALAAVEERLRPEYASAFVHSLPLILRLEKTTRAACLDLLERVGTYLTDPCNRTALRAGVRATDRVTRRYSYVALAKADPEEGLLLLKDALSDEDSVVRRWALNEVKRLEDRLTLRGLLEIALSDPIGTVRADALRTYTDAFPDIAKSRVITGMLDSSRAVREVARSWLGRTADFDTREFYRRALSDYSTPRIKASLQGLGEVGDAEDAALIMPFLEDPRTGVRQAAVEALGRLDDGDYPSSLSGALFDASRSVSRQASRSLVGRVRKIDAQEIWTRAAACRIAHARRHVLWLFGQLPKWDAVYYALLATDDEESDIREMAQKYLRRWISRFNKSFLTPTPTQIMRLRSELERRRFTLDKRTYRELEFCLHGH